MNPQRKFFPVQWKALPTNPQYRDGHNDSSFLYNISLERYIDNCLIFPFWMQVNPPPPPKKVNWHRESRLTPPYCWIHSQNIWHWDCVLVTVEYKGTRVMNKLSLMWRGLLSKWKPILIHTFVSCHSLDVLKIWIFRTNSSEATFGENISNFLDIWWTDWGYPLNLIEKLLSEMKFAEKKSALLKQKNWEEIDYCLLSGADYEALAFMTQYQLSVSTTKEVLMKKGNLLQNQPLLCQVFTPCGCPVMSAFAIWYILVDIYCWRKRVSTFCNDVKNYRTAVISAVA